MTATQSPASQRSGSAPPLAGVRVLDFTHILAGPFCTRLLADLGAEVLHVETRSRPDRMGATVDQSGGERVEPRSAYIHRNKKSITIDLKSDAGRALTTRLAGVADVIVENFSAGVMRRLHLDYKDLQPLNPGLIYVSMAGYGHSGPRRDWTSMNSNLQAYSGLMMVTGAEGDLPTSISNSWNDFIGGLHACFGILQSLVERRKTGLGRNLDLAQFECSVATLGPLVLASAVNGANPPRLGNRSAQFAPQGVYRCEGKDEWCAIAVQTDEQWRSLVAAMGNPAWAADARFDTAVGRLRAHDDIDDRIGAWTATLRKEEVEGKLKAGGVPAERMRRVDEVVDAPDAGHVFLPIEETPGRTTRVAGLPFTLSTSQTSALSSPAAMGEHNHSVLAEWLGLGETEIKELEAAGALV